jgi:uncharacterized protein YraI
MKRTGILLAAAMLLLPSAALAAPGLVTTTVSLRAGPGDGFPVVDRIPGGSHVNIHGCLKGDAWCDVSWSDDRGWVSSDELQWLYRNRYVYLSDYYDDIDVPIVPFVIGSYWSTYYAGRPFFHRRAFFDRYWRSHESIAMRTPDRIARARAGRSNAAVIEGRGRGAEARTAIETRNRTELRGRNEVRGAQAARIGAAERGRVANVNRSVGRGPAPMARAEHGARFSAAPAARPAPAARIAQPNISHGAPMNAHAQMPAPRAAAPAAMPRAAAPAAPHVAAPAAPAGGGGPGRHH